MAIVTDTVAVQRFAMGLFGVQVGSVTMAQVDKQIDRTSLGATLNSYYTSAFGAQTTAAVAATLVSNLGITGAGVANAVAYVTAKLNAAAPAARGEEIANIINMFSGMTNDAVYGAAAQTWNANVEAAAAYAGTANVAFGAVIQQSLTEGMDVLFGSTLADQFNADLTSGGNTLQGGDRIDGGAGNDSLHAVLATGYESITAVTSNIEKIVLTAQQKNGNNGDNNVADAGITAVDAGRMSGVNNWENSNSRADLLVEDVRIANSQITKDITITMRETDPGNVDFAVYFDQNSLRSSSASKSQVFLEVMDTRAAANAATKATPLLNSPYTGFAFTVTDSKGVSNVVDLKSDAINAAQTYADLVKAFQAAADAQFGAGTVTVTLGSDFTVRDTKSGDSVVGQQIVMTTNGSFTFSTPAGTSGWLAAGVSPADSGLHTNFFDTAPVTNTDLVTSTIVLDDVGRGSTGGDLVIGGLSVGDTSSSKGVQRFDITVEDNSKLQNIDSTNNTLREVSIVNGSTTRMTDAYTKTVKDAGNLTVKGNWDDKEQDNELPGAVGDNYGFNDVRLIDASTFKGMLDIDAVLSEKVTAKYMNLADAAPDAPAADNVTFAYNLGTNNDKFSLDIDANNMQVSGTTTREDFVLSINGGAGKDAITTDIINGGTEDGTAAWYNNSKLNANLSIDGGAGDDTIKTLGSGDWKITAGEGDDTVYSDNSGKKAAWVFNTTDQDAAAAAGSVRTLDNLKSSDNTKYNLYKGVAEVTFRGFTSKITIDSTGYKTSDLQINQAIKKAINSDAVLSKLLLATDGPANTLVVTSLIDGEAAVTDLAVSISKPAAGVLTASDIAAAGTAYKIDGTASEALVLGAMDDASMDADKGDYDANFGVNDAGTAISGDNSTQAADSTHTLGAGKDVLVLSTGPDSNEKIVYSGFENGTDTIVNFVTEGPAGTPPQAASSFFQSQDLANANLLASNANVPAGWTATVDTATFMVTFTSSAPEVQALSGSEVHALFDALRSGSSNWTSNYSMPGTAGDPPSTNDADQIDFSAYGVKAVLVDHDGTETANDQAFGTATKDQKYVLLTESATNDGSYVATVYTEGGTADDTVVGIIGTLDFGIEQNFVAANFIII